MKLDLMRDAPNVVRFPLERRGRPTLETLRLLSRAGDDAVQLADLYGLAVEWNARDRVGAEAHAAAQDLDGQAAREALLEEALPPLVAEGVAACLVALDASEQAEAARGRVAGVPKRSWLHEEMRERADALTGAAVAASVDAYHAVEEVEGVVRALALVRAGEAWSPRDWEAEAQEFDRLFLSGKAA